MDRARQHLEKASEAMTDTSTFFGLFGSPPDYILASHEFEQAGNILKAAKETTAAVSAYDQSANAHYLMESWFLAAKLWAACGKMVETELKNDALQYYIKAKESYILGGSLENAVKSLYHCVQLSEPLQALKYYLEIVQIFDDDDITADLQIVQKGLKLSLEISEYDLLNSITSSLTISKLLQKYYAKLTNKTMWGRQIMLSVMIHLAFNDYNQAESFWLQNSNKNNLDSTKIGQATREMLVNFQESDSDGFDRIFKDSEINNDEVANLIFSRIKLGNKPVGPIQDEIEEHGYL